MMQYIPSSNSSERQKVSVPGANWVDFSLPRLKSARPLLVNMVSSTEIVGGVLSAAEFQRFIKDESDEFRPEMNDPRLWVENQRIIEIPILPRDLLRLGDDARIVIWNCYSEASAEVILWLGAFDFAVPYGLNTTVSRYS